MNIYLNSQEVKYLEQLIRQKIQSKNTLDFTGKNLLKKIERERKYRADSDVFFENWWNSGK